MTASAVVVGIDDFEHSARAVAAAAHEAEARRVPLWLAHAYQWLPPVAAGIMPGGLGHAVLHHAHCPVVVVPESK